MTSLLDANVLIALLQSDHVHHDRAATWFTGGTDAVATCPVTQAALLRALVRERVPTRQSVTVLQAFTTIDRHEFWPNDVAVHDVDLRGVVGHRQVTDAYLAGLARHRGGSVVTFDRGLAALHPDVAVLLSATAGP